MHQEPLYIKKPIKTIKYSGGREPADELSFSYFIDIQRIIFSKVFRANVAEHGRQL
jgi:hypothetical protein